MLESLGKMLQKAAPIAKSLAVGIYEDYQTQKGIVQNKSERYRREAEAMSVDELKARCRNLRDSNDVIKKSVYAEVLKSKM